MRRSERDFCVDAWVGVFGLAAVAVAVTRPGSWWAEVVRGNAPARRAEAAVPRAAVVAGRAEQADEDVQEAPIADFSPGHAQTRLTAWLQGIEESYPRMRAWALSKELHDPPYLVLRLAAPVMALTSFYCNDAPLWGVAAAWVTFALPSPYPALESYKAWFLHRASFFDQNLSILLIALSLLAPRIAKSIDNRVVESVREWDWVPSSQHYGRARAGRQ